MRLSNAALIPVLLMATSGCMFRKHNKSDPDAPRPEPVQLVVLVVNQAPTETLVIRTADGRRFGTVMPNHSECIFLPSGVFQSRLVAVPVGGGGGWSSPLFSAQHSERWEWDVGSSRTAAGGLSMMPAEFDCEQDHPERRGHARADTTRAPAAGDTAQPAPPPPSR
ncbi:MAG TPA: hypothetical protein VFH27_16420 [Longimicrobiaceae bacterium]|nr:hypothetical protein [Longimicrobiaceae bacterium]